MTVNGLTIDDRIVNVFKRTYAEHCQNNGAPVCHKARLSFFNALKQQYGMEYIIPHLPALYNLLATWENEVRSEFIAA